MATRMERLEFKQRYGGYRQGLFILNNEKRFPKGQAIINLGKEVSAKLSIIPKEQREDAISQVLEEIVQPYQAISLAHLDVLFTEYLHLDVVRALLSLCRNRKICIVWPGKVLDGLFIYASPDRPEYYECDPTSLQDTYIIAE